MAILVDGNRPNFRIGRSSNFNAAIKSVSTGFGIKYATDGCTSQEDRQKGEAKVGYSILPRGYLSAKPQPALMATRCDSMNLAIVTVGYNLPGYTKRLVDSARSQRGHDLTFIVFLHSKMP